MKLRYSLFILLCSFFPLALAEKKIVTVWIHGTMIPAPPLLPKFAVQSYFHKNLGLTHIEQYEETDHLYKVAKVMHEAAPDLYELDHYYTFGWSGDLCFTKREEASQELYQELMLLVDDYIATHQEAPYLRIITHSHGGNVALNLANLISDADLSIDELIILACPVQEKTKHLVTASCFKKVYAFYSTGDIIQVMDPQRLYQNSNTKKLFSDRVFDEHDCLYQAQIQLNGHAPMHVSFISRPFCQYLPQLCQEVEEFYQLGINSEKETHERILDIQDNADEPIIIKKISYH